ncbi:MAG TPA: hypothetical protein VEH04_16100 [Verrucomicrobiae bacterium]|nr:hypothetical protein [Verrucomicrobiae bacterium]
MNIPLRIHWRHFLAVIVAGTSLPLHAAVINVTTNDSYSKIETAKAGDEVVIEPGTYRFRVYLTGQGNATNPIIIRAADPANRPVWDFESLLVETAPGSYTAGDRGRGAWQFSEGARHYRVSGIVIRNARTASRNSAAIRYYNSSTNLYISNCLFEWNDNGLTGGTQGSEATVEYCEFNSNGNTNASLSAPSHNIYVYGGYLTLRYCYVHDPVQGQNFHIRCRRSLIEYNWFARANSYEGDLMTDDDFSGSGPFTQTMTLRGNVIVQKANPLNNSQVVAVYNDAELPNLTLNVHAFYNTFVGNGGNASFIHLANGDGTAMNAEISNNIISGTGRPFLNDNPAAGTVRGQNNWLRPNATIGPLTGSVQSSAPGFRDASNQDFRLAEDSVCIGAANPDVLSPPGREYFLNEVTNRMWRIRAAARDMGAFESTSNGPVFGPNDPEPRPALSVSFTNGAAQVSWPLFAQDYQVQESLLLEGAAWQNASGTVTTNAEGVTMTVALTNAGFFRLRR